MSILNGFLRGAYDPEVTANIDQKEYSGVATDMYNFVGTKRGALSKRAPFVLRTSVANDSYFIPYVYDQDQRYLLIFEENPETGKAQFRMVNYLNGALTYSTVGSEPAIIQPTFTSDEQDNFVCSQSSEIDGYKAYQRFNDMQPMTLSQANGYSITLKFPNPVILSKLSIANRKVWSKSTIRPGSSTGGIITQYFPNIINFVVEGSNDGQSWFLIEKDDTQGSTAVSSNVTTTTTYSEINEYSYLRVRVTDTVKQSYTDSEECNFGNIKFTVLLTNEELKIDTPYTMQQIRELHWANENQRMVFLHKDVVPHEFRQTIQPLTVTGLDFTSDTLGNPTFGCFYQERLGLGGFTIANRQFNLSKSNPKSNQNFDFTLPGSVPVATDAMQFVIRRAKYPLREVLSGRNMIYLQCIDGLATISSGGDEVPLTPVQVAADLRNRTPFSDIPAVYQEELAFLVGSDYKTVYGMDYDFNVMRVRTIPINEHCLSYFDSGIAQMITMKGQLPYLVFRLNNGKILAATAYRTESGFNFHLYPMELADGTVECIGTLMNNQTGFDTLFAIVHHTNGTYTLESLESQIETYTANRGRSYFIENLMLDFQNFMDVSTKDDITFTYTGTVSETGRHLFTLSGGTVDLPDDEIKLIFNETECICKYCMFDPDTNDMWAEVSVVPPIGQSNGYTIPKRTFQMSLYSNLPVVLFDTDDIIEKVSEDDEGNITFARPVYQATAGLVYKAYAQFENIADVKVASQEKVITNIAASITYGTGIYLGTESVLEPVGFTDYPFVDWRDRILPDENLRNIPLADIGKKDKKIVLECNYPFPANITFITYDIKTTGVL